MNDTLMEELLHEEETETLDFKRDQYLFAGASDDDKSEIVKDVLAFANAWRRTDAYILIGVQEVKGGRSIVHGVTHHLDDANLQQLVNQKTQKPIAFTYEAFPFEGKQVGVIRIPLQERPFFLLKDFGKLKKGIVYIRRGSSTDEADPAEIAKMGIAVVLDQPRPLFELEFAKLADHTRLGRDITVVSTVVKYNEKNIPLVGYPQFSVEAMLNRYDENFFLKKARYIADTSLLSKVAFYIKNTGPMLASNTRVVIHGNVEPQIRMCDSLHYPEYPREELYGALPMSFYGRNRIDYEVHGKEWTITVPFGHIQPKAQAWSDGSFYVGATNKTKLDLSALIFADNLSDPFTVPLSITIDVKERRFNLKELDEDPEFDED
jgi:Putative DNA-binding domain